MEKNVLAIVVGIIIVIIGILIYGAMDDEAVNVNVVATSTPATGPTAAEVEAQRQQDAAQQAQRDADEAKTVAFTIDVTKLPEAQQLSLKAMGMKDTKIEITNAVMTCAKADMSDSRMAEIIEGASVTMSEGIKLVSCYNAN